MRKSKMVKIGESEVVVKELTAVQVGELIEGFDSNRKPHMAELLLNSVISIDVVVAATGVSAAELGDCTPSELDAIWTAVADVNDFLFRMLTSLVAVSG